MGPRSWRLLLAFYLVVFSVVLYATHFLIFRDVHHIMIYLLGDLAFLPLEVLFVTLVIHGVLSRHEKNVLLSKMNMVVGAFFSEMGWELLARLTALDREAGVLGRRLMINKNWTEKDFAEARRFAASFDFSVEIGVEGLEDLRDFLCAYRPTVLRLLENPNLLEHERTTDLLWAVTHLAEELTHRKRLRGLPEPDYKHLANDISRVYAALVLVWLGYVQHLQKNYPYLYSIACRTNPFDPDAKIIVTALN